MAKKMTRLQTPPAPALSTRLGCHTTSDGNCDQETSSTIRIPLPDSQGDSLPYQFRVTFDEMIEDAESELALQRRRVRQMRHQRRRQKRRDAARWIRNHCRAGLFCGGTAACTAGLVFVVLGQYGIAFELFKVAAAAWIAAASYQQPSQG